MKNKAGSPLRLGDILVQQGTISENILAEVLTYQKSHPDKKLGELLMELDYVNEDMVLHALAQQLGLSYFKEKEKLTYVMSVISLVPFELAKEANTLPLRTQGTMLLIATDDPLNRSSLDKIEDVTGLQVVTCLAPHKHIADAIEEAYKELSSTNVELLERVGREASADAMAREVGLSQEAENRVEDDATVQTVQYLLNKAVSLNASDIHLEPKEQITKVRVRIDGDLIDMGEIKIAAHQRMISRLKIMANLDISESRKPQDGGFHMTINNKDIAFRISIIPTYFGEKAVIRNLGDQKGAITPLAQLGVHTSNLKLLRKLIRVPTGIVLITGPTGSGKTTTIYSMLAEMARNEVNVVTIEDPVEKVIPFINQSPINVKAGCTFASLLRSMMRQDPDVIMVGEIRDMETATTASQAAITGHKVVSTLHTNDAPSTFMRLMDMGVEPYIVASSVAGVVAQRLVKRLCPKCKEPYEPSADELARLWKGETDNPVFYRGKGCPACNNLGYKGRIGIHEIITVTPKIRELITMRATSEAIRNAAKEEYDFRDLYADAKQFVREGITSLDAIKDIANSV